CSFFFFFFFSSRRRHTRSYGDWSSDVCSSDLDRLDGHRRAAAAARGGATLAGNDCRVLRVAPYASSDPAHRLRDQHSGVARPARSEERRVGKEWRWRGGEDRYEQKENKH